MANAFISHHHRHHRPVHRGRFYLGAFHGEYVAMAEKRLKVWRGQTRFDDAVLARWGVAA